MSILLEFLLHGFERVGLPPLSENMGYGVIQSPVEPSEMLEQEVVSDGVFVHELSFVEQLTY